MRKRVIVLQSLRDYPLRQSDGCQAATADQLRLAATGYVPTEIWHTSMIIKRFIPGEVLGRAERSGNAAASIDLIDRMHVPIALGSMLFACLLRS